MTATDRSPGPGPDTATPSTPPTASTASTADELATSSSVTGTADAPGTPRRRRRGRAPTLAWLGAIAVVALVAGGLGFAVRGAGAPPPTVDSTLPAGPVDIGFAQDMLDHHDQAVEIASFAEAHATSDMVRSMATAVLGTQRYEVGILEQFLHDHGADRGDPNRNVMGWMGMATPHDQMPGLQSHDAMVDYLNQQGPDLDRQFLTLMIAHHQGGVHMATYAADHAETAGLRQLAARMVVEQQTEIGDYQSALSSLP